MTDTAQFIRGITVWALPAIFAITLHEASHGFVASALGDQTARKAGRLSLNPLRHIDPFGTVVLPGLCLFLGGFLWGYAKPVPVNFRALAHPKRDMALVAAAGPLTNIALAIASLALLYAVPYLPVQGVEWAQRNLVNSAQINVLLAVFNMLPLPPLDGGRVAVGILPRRYALPLARLEDKGLLILLVLIFGLPFLLQLGGIQFDPFKLVIGFPTQWILVHLAHLVGIYP